LEVPEVKALGERESARALSLYMSGRRSNSRWKCLSPERERQFHQRERDSACSFHPRESARAPPEREEREEREESERAPSLCISGRSSLHVGEILEKSLEAAEVKALADRQRIKPLGHLLQPLFPSH
jgi:hypothetical protein